MTWRAQSPRRRPPTATRTSRAQRAHYEPNSVVVNHQWQGQRDPTPTYQTTRRRGNPGQSVERRGGEGTQATVSKDVEAKGTQSQHVERRGGGGNPMPTCRTTRRRREPHVEVSNDAEAKGTPRQRVERQAGEGNPTSPCRKTGIPPSPCLSTRRRRKPNAEASDDAEAKATQCRRLERQGGGGTQRRSIERHTGEGAHRQHVERRRGGGNPASSEQSCLALLFVFTYFHVHTYNPKEDYPSLGKIYSFTTIYV